ncbi:MAG: YbbR-like domain-containing protein [Aquificae bacterium]|nr:YbbR-like domain-containing protein [Aquificota bacterium]
MKKIFSILFSNLPLKLLSLLVAFLLWLNITSMQKSKIEFYTPIEVRNVPENIIITKIKPDKVLVIIEGYKGTLSTIDISDIKAYVDGKKIKPGNNVLTVQVEIPTGLKLIGVRPKTIIVKAIEEKKKGES